MNSAFQTKTDCVYFHNLHLLEVLKYGSGVDIVLQNKNSVKRLFANLNLKISFCALNRELKTLILEVIANVYTVGQK